MSTRRDASRRAADRHGAAGTEPHGQPPPTVPEAPGDADLVIWTDETRAAVIEPIVNDCAAMEGANIAVQQIAYGDLDDAVLQTAPRGTGPDLFTYAHDSLGNFVESGIVAPFDLSQFADQYQDVAVEAFTYKGQTYGLPYAVENIALFRNTDLVPEAPATFEELETIALQLKSEGTVETPLAIQQAPTADPYHNYPMYSGGGGYVFGTNPDGSLNPQDVGLDSPGGLAAAELWEKWTAEGLVSGSVSQDIMKEQFTNGQTPFAITGPWNLTRLRRCRRQLRRRTGAADQREPDPPVRRCPGLHDLRLRGQRRPRHELPHGVHQQQGRVARLLRGPAATAGAHRRLRRGEAGPVHPGLRSRRDQGEAQPNIREMGAVWEAWTKAYQTIFNGGDGTKAFQDAAAEIDANIAAGG